MRLSLRSFAVLSTVAVSAAALAGDINPPIGPVQETGRIAINPQTAVFPIQINQPGSYVLLGDLTVNAAVNGIEITANDVTLDMNGFTLDGAGVAFEGIFVNGANSNVAIRNGTIRNCSNGGVFASAGRLTVEDLRSFDNGFEGINVGFNGRILRCVADGNSTGLFAGSGSRVEHSSAVGNSTGIFVSDNVTVKDCDVLGSTGVGISIGRECRISGNRVQAQGAGGAAVSGIDHRNSGVGRSLIDSNFVVGYDPAIRVDPTMPPGEVFIVRNTVLDAGGAAGAGYEPNGNLVPVGLSTNPDTADAWDNFWWVTVVRSEGSTQLGESSSAPAALRRNRTYDDPRDYRK